MFKTAFALPLLIERYAVRLGTVVPTGHVALWWSSFRTNAARGYTSAASASTMRSQASFSSAQVRSL